MSQESSGERAKFRGLIGNLAVALPYAVVVVSAIGLILPSVPTGVCHGDTGGLQLAAGTLGITHPPGYSIHATLGHVLSLLPGITPAMAIVVINVLCGVLVLALGMVIMTRVGVHAAFGGVMMLAFAAWPQVSRQLAVPEVYLPALALSAGAVVFAERFRTRGRDRDLFLSALMVGVAIAHRPPALFLLPFAVATWIMVARRRGSDVTAQVRRSLRTPAIVTACLLGPTLYAVSYLLVRDVDSNAYNYLRSYNKEMEVLPPTSSGLSAKVTRVAHHMSGRQFSSKLSLRPAHVRQKLLRWLPRELGRHPVVKRLPAGPWSRWKEGCIACVLALVGLVVAYRKDFATGLMLIGMMASSVVYVAVYQSRDDASDLLPIMFVLAIAIGISLSIPLRRYPTATRWVGWLMLMLVFTLRLSTSPRGVPEASAMDFLAQVDMNSMPQDSVIMCSWADAPPLWYAREFLVDRKDIEIINAAPVRWKAMMPEDGRPVFCTRQALGVGSNDRIGVLFRLRQLDEVR